jgi:uncharacterized membrane protein
LGVGKVRIRVSNTTKLLGAWGGLASLLLFPGFLIPGALLLALAGTICLIVAYYRSAGELQRPAIGSSMTVSLVLLVIGVVAFKMLIGATVFSLIKGATVSSLAWGVSTIFGGLISWILFIVASWFWYKAAAELAAGSGINLFKTAGLIYFVGAITIVVFGLGLLLMLVGSIMQIVAFFSIPEQPAVTATN